MSLKDLILERLKGSSNYHSWKFAIKNYLEMQDLDKYLETDDATVPKDKQKAKNILSLSVESSVYVHIQNAKSAKEIWTTLQRLYEDKGLSRKIGLLRQLISFKLEDSDGMDNYIERIINTSNKLTGIGFEISDEWIGAILLAGLTEDYKALILGIESSGKTTKSDDIISKLIDNRIEGSSSNNNAFMGKKVKKFNKNFKRKCFSCGSTSHLKYECDKVPRNDSKNNSQGKSKTRAAFITLCAKNIIDKNSNEEKNSKAMITMGNENDWYLDSGASCHMTPYRNKLKNTSESKIKSIITANNEKINVCSTGNTMVNIDDKDIEIKNVLFVPKLCANLLSVKKIVDNGNKVIFNKNNCTIYNEKNEIITKCVAENGVYKLHAIDNKCFTAETNDNAMLWHRRFGHLNYNSMCKMRNGAVIGMEFNDSKIGIENCETCAMGKQHRLSFGKSTNESKGLLDLIHSDVMGPMETLSIGRARFILTFVDDYSRKVFCYFLHSKSDVFDKFIELKNLVERQLERKIKNVRTDNGTEYVNKKFEEYFKLNGIQHQLTAPYTPEQNGVAERMNRTIIEKARCLLYDANLPKNYWAEAVNMSVYLINRSVNTNSMEKTPEEIWTNKKIDVSKIKLFGSEVMVHIPKEKRQKWDYKSQKLIFVGYEENSKAYRCIDKATRKLTISRDVIFLEKVNNDMNIEFNTDEVRDNDSENNIQENDNQSGLNTEVDNREKSSGSTTEVNRNANGKKIPIIDLTDTSTEDDDNPNDPDYHPGDDIVATVHQNESVSRLPREVGIDIDSDDSDENSESSCNVMHANLSILNDIEFIFKCDEEQQLDDPMRIEDLPGRNDYKKWESAMNEEMASLNENNTWDLIHLPKGKKVIKTKWVFKTKRDVDGNVIRHKARLVVKGFTQRYGIDYDQTYSPVVRYTSIRFLIALAVKNQLKIHQMDAITAFLQGEIDTEIFIEQPDGFKDDSNRVCKLNRAMYGLKQAGRVWNKKLDSTLKNFGLKSSCMDPCIYYANDLQLIVAIYVDDFLIFYHDEQQLKQLKGQLCERFRMKDMGAAKGCVGIRIKQSSNSIELDQTVYIEEVLKRFGMSESKPIGNPSDTSIKLTANMEVNDNKNDVIPYQQAIGCLLFISGSTRPDISFSVNDASRFNNNHNQAHWNAVKRIMRYLNGTKNLKLVYSRNQEDIKAYTDADWASDVDSRKSCTGYVFTLSGAAISWRSMKQKTTALSSTEAEYIALSTTTQEAIWFQQLKDELGIKNDIPLMIYCDNQSTIKLAENDGYQQRTKHIDIRYHFLREKIRNKIINVKFVNTEKNIADALTKAVTKEKHQFCSKQMGLKYITN